MDFLGWLFAVAVQIVLWILPLVIIAKLITVFM